VLPIPTKENRQGDNKLEQLGDVGPLSVLGYAKTFRQTRTTDEWMKDLREGSVVISIHWLGVWGMSCGSVMIDEHSSAFTGVSAGRHPLSN